MTEGWFVQALEGDESVVRGLYERISEDPRHEDVTVIESAPVDGRVFSRWAMAQVSRSGQADIPLHVHVRTTAAHPEGRGPARDPGAVRRAEDHGGGRAEQRNTIAIADTV